MLIKTKTIMPEEITVSMNNDFTSVGLLCDSDTICFDIETTGFSASATQVYLIGCMYFDGKHFQLIQWFSETSEDEIQLLHSFFQFIQPFHTLMHYNGEGFDMPYLLRRCRHYQMKWDFSQYKSIDLYKLISPYKHILMLPNLKQKTIEQYLGVSRKDEFHGGELIGVYYDYVKTKEPDKQQLLLLHNHDDLLGMLGIFPIMAYYYLFHGEIDGVSYEVHPYSSAAGKTLEEIIFTFQCVHPVPHELSYRKGAYYLTVHRNIGKLSVQIFTDELKYFFPNYKDYYYLPIEDESIHKSVAFCVDKNFRTQATAANCYTKKSGRFLPQPTEQIKPHFKQNYKDKQTYFEITPEFENNSEVQLVYLKRILTSLGSQK